MASLANCLSDDSHYTRNHFLCKDCSKIPSMMLTDQMLLNTLFTLQCQKDLQGKKRRTLRRLLAEQKRKARLAKLSYLRASGDFYEAALENRPMGALGELLLATNGFGKLRKLRHDRAPVKDPIVVFS